MEMPRSHKLRTNDWETLDTLWGVNAPTRYIHVITPGFYLRKKIGFFGGKGNRTPGAVNYGGQSAIAVHTVQVKGRAGQTVHFVQGVGSV